MNDDLETLKAKLALAMQALELASDVMSYCAGDAWEREATAKERESFEAIYDQFFPPPPPEPSSWQMLFKKPKKMKCDMCNKICGGKEGVKAHKLAKHAAPSTDKPGEKA